MLTNVREHVSAELVDEGRPDGVELRQISVMGGSGRGSGGPSAVARPLSPVDAMRQSYYANIYVYACARAIATDLAARPFRVGADPTKPNDFDPNHPLAQRLSPPGAGVLSRPNPVTSARRLWAWSAVQRIVTGALGWEIDGDLNFWPIPTTTFEPVKETSSGKISKSGWFKEFKLSVGGGQTKRLRPDQMFYSWNPAQDDWTRAESSLEANGINVSVMVMQDVYDAAFLRNDARPAQIVVHQAFESAEAETKFRRQFLNRHQGPRNAGRTAFVKASPNEGGPAPKDAIFIQQLGLSQRDAEFIKRYESKLRAICVGMGVPLSRLGDASARTFSNADRETLNYWLDTVQPLGFDLADDVNTDLMPLFDGSGNVGWFDWSGIADLQPAKRFAVEEVLQMKAAGVITVEEARTEIGFDPDGAPEVEVPEDDGGVDGVPDIPIAASAQNVLTVRDMTNLLDVALAPLQAALRGQRDTPPALPPGEDAPSLPAVADEVADAYEKRSSLWHQTNRTVERLESMWERRIQKLLNRQLESVLSRLNGKRGRQMLRDGDDVPANIRVENVFDQTFWVAATEELTDDLYEEVVETAFRAFDVTFDISFDVDAPFARNYIQERSNYLARNLTDTTYEAIKAELVKGAAEGESIPHLADRIEHLFNVTWDSRAETVARTEVISAYNGSTWLATYEAPADVIGGLQWISTRDNRTRASHAAMDGTIIRRGEAFYLDGATMMYPGDPEVATRYDSSGNIPSPGSMIINCRCTIAPILTEELPVRERSANERMTRAAAERLLLQVATGAVSPPEAIASVNGTGVRGTPLALPPAKTPAPVVAPAPDQAQRVVVEVKNAMQTLHVHRDPETGNIVALSPDPKD